MTGTDDAREERRDADRDCHAVRADGGTAGAGAGSDESGDRSGGTDDRPAGTDDRPAGTGAGALTEGTLVETFPDYADQKVHAETVPPRPARTVPAGEVLDADLADRLDADLFTHQAEALDLLADGENVAVTTSTSSGKTWVYALQIARAYRRNPESTALCLYPTKALSRDQEQALNDKLRSDWGLDVTVGVYDGDTTAERKRTIRTEADVIVTNFAGLNAYLPRHARDDGWHRFYDALDVVVVDEAHEYSGLTGMHVAWILRRLRRLLRYYDAGPQFVVTTATVGNPAEHARRLTGADFAVVDRDGSPRGRRDVVLWEPPVDWDALDEDDDPDEGELAAVRTSATAEAARVTAHLGLYDLQTLLFCGARQGAEVAAKRTARAAGDHDRPGGVDVEAYHAGLGKRTRRAVENELKADSLDAVASTNALELGIDVGSVDATVAAGYPGTKQSFWQQVGRAGRGDSEALSVLVAGDDAMDRYVLDDPSYLFDDDVEDAVVGLDNDAVYADHLLCAATERPLTAADADLLGGEDRLRETVGMWRAAGVLAGDLAEGVVYTGDRRPQGRLSIYATTGRSFEVVAEGTEIDHDPVAEERAYRDYHEGALFLHAGQQYEVTDVVEGRRPRIHVRPASTRRYTQTLSEKHVTDLDVRDCRDLGEGYQLYFGRGTVSVTYDGYLVRDVFSGELLEGPLPTGSPPVELRTDVAWVSLPPDHVERTLDRLDAPLLSGGRSGGDVPSEPELYTYAGGLHAAEHGCIQLAPLELLVDDSDVGGLSTPHHPHRTVDGPVWFVHDGIDGGVGFTRAIYEDFGRILRRTREFVGDCECGRRKGCPACVMSEDCGNRNEPLDTLTAGLILDDVLARLE